MSPPFTILNCSGPYREPREPVFSHDYSIQRPTWPTPHGVRVKISIPDELDHAKNKILNIGAGTAGQVLLINQMLTRRLSDQKLVIAEAEGMLNERADVLIDVFKGALAHLFPKLEAWLTTNRDTIRDEILKRVGELKPVAK